MEKNKLKVIQDYKKLSQELKEQLKLVYPNGFGDHLEYFVTGSGQKVIALRFETDEKIYLLRMSEDLAYKLVEDDPDYDEDHNLLLSVKEEYELKHADVEYLNENENFQQLDE